MFWRRRKDEECWKRWEWLVATYGLGAVTGPPTLVTVIDVRQRASTGLKGYLHFPPHEVFHAMWIENGWPSPGTSMVVTGHIWDDPPATHHGEVVYVVDAVHEVVLPAVMRGWQRHQRRLDRKRRRQPVV